MMQLKMDVGTTMSNCSVYKIEICTQKDSSDMYRLCKNKYKSIKYNLLITNKTI